MSTDLTDRAPEDAVDPPRSGSRKHLAAPTIVLALLATTAGTLAVAAAFTGNTSSESNTLSAGRVDLAATPGTPTISMIDTVPGSRLTRTVTVSNSGTLPMRYALRSTTTEDVLAAQLDMTIKTGVSACNDAGFDSDGSRLYGAADLGSVSGLNLIGDPALGPHDGDRVLNAGAAEVLCVQVSMPISSSNAYKGLSTTATFSFSAEQIG